MKFNNILTEEMYKQHQLWLHDYNTGTQLVLQNVELSNAYLYSANLSSADIRFCDPDNIRIKRITLPPYKVNILDNQIVSIGCKQHHINDWKSFSNDQIDQMDTDALKWWNTHKQTIFNFIEEQ